MDLLLPAFQLLYFVAHFLVSLCQAVYDALLDLYRIAWEITRWLVQTPRKGPFVPSKAPQHPVLVLLPGQYKSSQLQQVVEVLAVMARGGASCLTVYEAAGKLRDKQWALQDLLQAALPALNIHLIPDETADDSNIQQQSGEVRDAGVGDVLLLRVVSLESGGRALLSIVRQLARAARPGCVVEITCEALHGFLATPHCCSCWGRNDVKRNHSSTDNIPRHEQIGGEESYSDDESQLDNREESNARRRCLQQQTKRDSGANDSLELENVVKTHPESCLPPNSVLVKNSFPPSKKDITGNTDFSFEHSSGPGANGPDVDCAEQKWCRFGGSLLPDPDLVLVVGEYLSSNGFPPWFLRLSEFVCTPRLHKIDQAELTRILQNYSKTEQRYGR